MTNVVSSMWRMWRESNTSPGEPSDNVDESLLMIIVRIKEILTRAVCWHGKDQRIWMSRRGVWGLTCVRGMCTVQKLFAENKAFFDLIL